MFEMWACRVSRRPHVIYMNPLTIRKDYFTGAVNAIFHCEKFDINISR
jgi:hypothetical protein